MQGGYSDGEIEGTDFDAYELVIGVHPNVGDNTDLVFDLVYGNIDPDVSGSQDADFFGVSAGFRHMATQRFEINMMANYRDSDNFSGSGSHDDVSAEIGGRFNFGAFSSGVTYLFARADQEDAFQVDLRWSFDCC